MYPTSCSRAFTHCPNLKASKTGIKAPLTTLVSSSSADHPTTVACLLNSFFFHILLQPIPVWRCQLRRHGRCVQRHLRAGGARVAAEEWAADHRRCPGGRRRQDVGNGAEEGSLAMAGVMFCDRHDDIIKLYRYIHG